MLDDDDRLLDLDQPGRARQHRFGGALSSRGAIFHLNARTGSRSKGQSARAAAAYIQREAEYGRDRDQTDELVYAESDHMPSWAEAEPTAYWDAADLHERANGRLFKRVEVALPVALSVNEQRELAVGFAHSLTDDEQLPYTLAIHAGAGTNPHCHLLISERTNDGLERSPERWFSRYNAADPEQGGARKTRALYPKAWLEETRAAWAAQTNQALERAGHAIRIDHRSLEAQGIERLPSVHLGPTVQAMEARGIDTERGAEARHRERVNAQLAALTAQQEEVEHERTANAERGRGDPRLAAGRDRAADGLGAAADNLGRAAGGLGSGDRRESGQRLGASRDPGRGAPAGPGPAMGAGVEADAGAVARGGADPAQPSLGHGRPPREPDRTPGGPGREPGRADRAVVSGLESELVADAQPGPVGESGRELDGGDALLAVRAAGAGAGTAGGAALELPGALGRDDRGGAGTDSGAAAGSAERQPVAAEAPAAAEAQAAEQARQREAAVEQAAARTRAQLAATREARQATRERLAATRAARQAAREREQEHERQQARARQRGRGRDEDFDLER